MNRDGLRTVLSVVVLVLVLVALRKVFLEWNSAVPQSAPAADRSLVHPKLLGQESSGVFHDDRCDEISVGQRLTIALELHRKGFLFGYLPHPLTIPLSFSCCPMLDHWYWPARSSFQVTAASFQGTSSQRGAMLSSTPSSKSGSR